MTIFLFVLKLLGIILLTILGIAITLLLCIVFWPVGYRVTGEITDDHQISLKVHAHWLLHILAVHIRLIDEKPVAFVRIFGIKIRLYPKKEASRERKAKPKKEKNKRRNVTSEINCEEPQDRKQEIGQVANQEVKQEAKREAKQETKQETKHELIKEAKQETKHELKQETKQDIRQDMQHDPKQAKIQYDSEEQSNRKKGHAQFGQALDNLLLKIKNLFLKAKNLILKAKNLVYAVKHFWQKVIALFTKAGSIKAMILDETNRKASQFVLKELLYVWKHYRPRTVKTKLEFSLGDPALTGEVLGVISLLPVMYQYQIGVYPDFVTEEIYLLGTFFMRGHIRMMHVIKSAWHIWRDENTKKLIQTIRT